MGWDSLRPSKPRSSWSPVVVWIDFRSLASGVGYGTSTWTAFDGRTIPYTSTNTPSPRALCVPGSFGHAPRCVLRESVHVHGSAVHLDDRDLLAAWVLPSALKPLLRRSQLFVAVAVAGPVAGGQTVTVSGTGFDPAMTVSLGGSAVTATATSTSFTMTTTAATDGYAQLLVTNSAGSNHPGAGSGTSTRICRSRPGAAPFRTFDTRAGSRAVRTGRLSTKSRTVRIAGVTASTAVRIPYPPWPPPSSSM